MWHPAPDPRTYRLIQRAAPRARTNKFMNNDSVLISDSGALSRFIHSVDHLHDALLHEAVIVHPGHVDRAGRMWQDSDLPEARLIFQSQSPDFSGVLLVLHQISTFKYDPRLEFRLEAELDPGEVAFYLSGKANAPRSEMRAARASYKILGKDSLGSDYMLVAVDVSADGSR